MPQSVAGVQARSVSEKSLAEKSVAGKSLAQRVSEAVQSHATPISQLLRLMWQVDAEPGANENLRAQLRARIGAPLAS